MPSASSIEDGPGAGRKRKQNKGDQIWVGFEYESFHGSTVFCPANSARKDNNSTPLRAQLYDKPAPDYHSGA